MAKTVFFTVLHWRQKLKLKGKATHAQIVLDLLRKDSRAVILELDEFNPIEDSDQVKDFVALFEPDPRKFSGRCQIVDERMPGLPGWARVARGRVLIGPKITNSPANLASCVEQILQAFPPLSREVPVRPVVVSTAPGFRQRVWKWIREVVFLSRQH